MQSLPAALAGLLILAGLAGFVGLIYAWEVSFTNSNSLVVYFGRPSEVPPYLASNWNYLFWASSNCLLTAIASLFLAGVVAIALLAIGLLNDSWLKRMEWFAVAS